MTDGDSESSEEINTPANYQVKENGGGL